MKSPRILLSCLLLCLLGFASFARADDIDIYSDNAGTTGVPNVLLVLDNAANFEASAGACTYVDGTSPSLGATAGGIEQCAIYNVVSSLPEGAVNIGLMVYNANNIRDIDNANCGGSNGGCLVQPLVLMSGAVKTKFLAWVKTWRTTGGSGDGYIKANGEATGAAMQEAWAYYAGNTGLSGRSYAGIQPPSGCQKNFVIFIGNAFNVSGTPGEGGSASPMAALAAAPGVTAEQKAAITIPSGTYGTSSFSCRGSYTMPNHTDSSGLYADEWARYMYQTDIYGSLDDKQGITTYTVGLLGSSCKPDYPALLNSMATVGGGKYFATSSYEEISTALLKILNEVQAVNSVFSSASLPVSVNAQGTFLNQIFLGMFRPDASANPRWVGNLKQYQFIVEHVDPLNPDPNTATLKLGDSLGQPAISAAGTGFITPSAISFWTKKDITKAPDSTGGFFVKFPSDSQGAGGAFDSPDGELVEKGGAAQQLRLAHLVSDYSAAAGSSTNSRRLYTYCPSNTGCEASLNHASNAFATSNAGITDAMLSSVATVSVTSIVRTGITAVVTTGAAHGLITGDSVTISGATQPEYNGVKNLIVKLSDTQFSFTVVEYPPSPATGSYTVSVASSPKDVTSITRSGTLATATVAAHGYVTGQSVTLSGADQTAYKNIFTITKINDDSFSFTVAESPVALAGSGTAKVGASTKSIESSTSNPNPGVVRVGNTVTFTTTSNHGFANSGTVTIAGVVDPSNGGTIAEYNGTFSFIKTSNKSFTITVTTSPASPATGTIKADASSSPKTITSLTRAGSVATATVASHGFSVGQKVNIGGTPATNEDAYVGSFDITATTSNTFDYAVTTTPVTPATGTIVIQKAGTSDRTALINWVRGEDNFGDELSPGSGYNIRASVHGDVLHSRPVVVNYGDARGLVAFYGANDGVFRAINGSQTAAIGSVPAGGELWGLVLPEHFSKLNRQRINSPELKLSTSIAPGSEPKNYFVDGTPGIFQQVNEQGAIVKAYLYLTMRRGGRMMYAIDVTTPTNPKFMWKISSADGDFSELGQTWSRPQIAIVKGYAKPVIVFGAGYDPAEDVEPPSTGTMGRGIYVLDAETGVRVWKATVGGGSTACGGTSTQGDCTVAGMNWGIASDLSAVDRDSDGYTDRLYAPDLGGNIWRVDLEPSGGNTPDKWQVTKFAALGCSTGVCLGGTPRKFMFPPSVVTVGAAGAAGSYDVVLLGSGDREHPLATSASFSVENRFYALKDVNTGKDAALASTITEASPLFNATTAEYFPGTDKGFYLTFGTGEKSVNTATTARGVTYFGTNKPTPPSATSCASNLGQARGYALNPFSGLYSSAVFDGGGLPPSPVADIVCIGPKCDQGEGEKYPFCIGCPRTQPPLSKVCKDDPSQPGCEVVSCTGLNVALEGGRQCKQVAPQPRRTYWHKR